MVQFESKDPLLSDPMIPAYLNFDLPELLKGKEHIPRYLRLFFSAAACTEYFQSKSFIEALGGEFVSMSSAATPYLPHPKSEEGRSIPIRVSRPIGFESAFKLLVRWSGRLSMHGRIGSDPDFMNSSYVTNEHGSVRKICEILDYNLEYEWPIPKVIDFLGEFPYSYITIIIDMDDSITIQPAHLLAGSDSNVSELSLPLESYMSSVKL